MQQNPQLRPEASSPFANIGNHALIDQFYATEGDLKIGRELSTRMLAHAGFTGDPTTEPLLGSDGRQVHDRTNEPLVWADYVNYAAEHHPYALEQILGFLLTTPGEQDYKLGRQTIEAMWRRQQGGNG